MRRTALSISLLTLLAVFVIGAQDCGTVGPAARTFTASATAHALVIPMDNCYQKRDSSASNQTVACNGSRDDGIFRAYGLVYFLLKHGKTVYWAIDGSTPKSVVTGIDVTVPSGSMPLVKKLDWSTFQFNSLGLTSGQAMSYIGGPFIIDPADEADVLTLLHTDPDFASFRSEKVVEIHEVESTFTANQVRTISGTPPKIAILNISGPKTSAGVMINYAKAAGFNWTCNGACTQADGSDCDCAGGISGKDSGCTKANILSKYSITVNNGPGKVYDILCDKDFVPDYTIPSAPDFTKATLLRKDANAYKLLWAPHWESKRPSDACTDGTVNPSGKTIKCGTLPDPNAAIGTGQRELADTLTCIKSFVAAGNNLFAECHAIVTLEGGYGLMDTGNPIKEYGLPATQFQATAKMNQSVSSGVGSVAEFLPVAPYMQIGDFAFANVDGNVSAYLPDPSGNSTFSMPASDYRAFVEHYITQTGGSPNLDVLTGLKQAGEGATGGAVVYLGGHDYSSQTAGTRIVLNTLFSLGFGCADPNTECSTGLQGACAKGHLKCAAGGVQCVPDTASSVEVCDGIDNDCNGQIDEGGVCNHPVCNSGDVKSCYDGPAGTAGNGACKSGTQTCSGGFWGPCTGQVLPTPEVCNNKDDDCNGTVDNGTLCGSGDACTSGICLPTTCNSENARCPTGFTCNSGTKKCDPDPCPTTACPAGQVCQNGTACKDPCDGVTCGQGSACSGGVCQGGGCALSGCPDPSTPTCVNGTCVADPCASANCPTGTFCRLGDCVRSCSYVECAPGQQCSADGFCESCNPACGAGLVCANGSCVTDLCAGVTCGAGQACQGGSCADDPCTHVTCTVGTCTAGQCTGGSVKTSDLRTVADAKSGGCGSSGGGGLVSVFALLAVAAWRRWPSLRRATSPRPVIARRTGPHPATARATVAVAAAALLAAASATGCSKGSSAPSCKDGQSACGSTCVDLATAADNCGVCGRACATGFVCVAKGCSMDTGNPYLRKVEPATLGLGEAVTLQLSGDEFKDGATVRVTGPGPTQTLSLGADGKTSSLDLSGYAIGNALVRVVNPPNLVSNAVTVPIQVQTVLRGAVTGSPPKDASSVQQDNTSAVSVTLVGAGFANGAVATLTGPLPATTSQALTTGFVDSSDLAVSGLVPSTLAVGTYDLTVTNPGGTPTTPLKFNVNEGKPVLDSMSPASCVEASATFSGTVSGSYLYPTSVVHVSSVGISGVLGTACLKGTNTLGQCTDGQLRVSQDLSAPNLIGVTFTVKVVNPGSPPLESENQPPPTITVKAPGNCP